ncbi:hypothetical protein Scep_004546 [Stephania cephalantha]|uniref:Uncharacterized protein n=1 Tax=Stephania cephalantha TaxID=152367 RepID=A0AAP0PVG7_9MAGN
MKVISFDVAASIVVVGIADEGDSSLAASVAKTKGAPQGMSPLASEKRKKVALGQLPLPPKVTSLFAAIRKGLALHVDRAKGSTAPSRHWAPSGTVAEGRKGRESKALFLPRLQGEAVVIHPTPPGASFP